MKEKACCFAGHRYEWQSVGVEGKLRYEIERLIQDGFNVFYDGGYGVFDEKARKAVVELRKKYPHIKLIRVTAYYVHEKEKANELSLYDEYIYPSIEGAHYKSAIGKRNEWLVDNCEAIICHIEHTQNSGAYKMVKYAQKKNKNIINV